MLKIQNLLHICSEHYEQPTEEEKKEKEKKKKEEDKKEADKKDGEAAKDGEKKKEEEKEVDLSLQQMIAVLGLGLIAMGEDIGSEMLFR